MLYMYIVVLILWNVYGLYLNVILMNTRSLPKRYGELLCMLSVLETRFDVIILTEIGARNLTTVQNIMNEYNFYYVIPENNFYGGVGIYVHSSTLVYVWWMNWRLENHVIAPDVKMKVYS